MWSLTALGASRRGRRRPLARALLKPPLRDRHTACRSGLRTAWLPAQRYPERWVFEHELADLWPRYAVEHDLAIAARGRWLRVGLRRMSVATVETSTSAPRRRVCVVCGASLAGRSEASRHCSAACRVEASRLRAILAGNCSGPYASVRERLEAAQRGVQRPLPRREDGGADGR